MKHNVVPSWADGLAAAALAYRRRHDSLDEARKLWSQLLVLMQDRIALERAVVMHQPTPPSARQQQQQPKPTQLQLPEQWTRLQVHRRHNIFAPCTTVGVWPPPAERQGPQHQELDWKPPRAQETKLQAAKQLALDQREAALKDKRERLDQTNDDCIEFGRQLQWYGAHYALAGGFFTTNQVKRDPVMVAFAMFVSFVLAVAQWLLPAWLPLAAWDFLQWLVVAGTCHFVILMFLPIVVTQIRHCWRPQVLRVPSPAPHPLVPPPSPRGTPQVAHLVPFLIVGVELALAASLRACYDRWLADGGSPVTDWFAAAAAEESCSMDAFVPQCVEPQQYDASPGYGNVAEFDMGVGSGSCSGDTSDTAHNGAALDGDVTGARSLVVDLQRGLAFASYYSLALLRCALLGLIVLMPNVAQGHNPEKAMRESRSQLRCRACEAATARCARRCSRALRTACGALGRGLWVICTHIAAALRIVLLVPARVIVGALARAARHMSAYRRLEATLSRWLTRRVPFFPPGVSRMAFNGRSLTMQRPVQQFGAYSRLFAAAWSDNVDAICSLTLEADAPVLAATTDHRGMTTLWASVLRNNPGAALALLSVMRQQYVPESTTTRKLAQPASRPARPPPVINNMDLVRHMVSHRCITVAACCVRVTHMLYRGAAGHQAWAVFGPLWQCHVCRTCASCVTSRALEAEQAASCPSHMFNSAKLGAAAANTGTL